MKKFYSMRSYWAYTSHYKLRFFSVMFIFAFSNTMLVFIPVFIGRLVEAASANPVNASEIWKYVIALIASSVLHDVTWRMSELAYMKLIMPLTFWYENGLFKTVLQKPYPYFIGKFTGKVSKYIATLREEYDSMLDNTYWDYVRLVVLATATTSILFSINVVTGVVFVVGALLLIVVGRFTIGNNLKYEAIYTDKDSTKSGKVVDVVSNFVSVKSFAKEFTEYKRLVREQRQVLNSKQESFKWAIVFWASMSFIIRELIWPVTIVLNVHFFLNGTITIGELTTFLSTITLFSEYIWEMIWQISQLGLRAARAEEAHRYLFGENEVMIPKEDSTGESSESTATFAEKLSLSGVTFAYPDQPDQVVLDHINLDIKKGEKVGIVGHSGSGKTTLVKLLLGYYDRYDGTIELDGRTVANKQLLSVISYVPQDTTLFNRTIADNISYAVDHKVTQDDIERVSKQSLSHDFIAKIPEGYEAVVGERGVKLSTGQRQRLSIARAMLQDRPLLILDEATSALDSENETLVQQSLENLWHDRAVISIAHRLSTLRKMDRIVVMDKGRIVEQGTITQLLKEKGAFHDLWNHQVNGMIIE